jgi:glutamate synthase domain-containing protein 2
MDPKVMIGEKNCTHPYACSLLNVSAMSYGSLSNRAILALNEGAKKGGFAHNTGEGGVSSHHLKHGGDLIWQIGTGYFGCRAEDGGFSEEKYIETIAAPSIKMVELKISQGAKPGHGGILPAKKNTPEIAQIRGVEAGTIVNSPPAHTAFNSPEGLLHFIKKLRDLSGGRPVGFKLCIGKKAEFEEICNAMISTGITPDFITVDGGEGGTGAAPVEFSNSVGTPYMDGLAFVHDTLLGYGLRKDIKIGASGKITTGFHMVRALSLGADFCNSARAMMMALGCIQALLCNTNQCPVGVATQDKELIKGLNVKDKSDRVYHYHHKTIHSFVEMLGAAGISDSSQLNRSMINRRIDETTVATYEDIFPTMTENYLKSDLVKN